MKYVLQIGSVAMIAQHFSLSSDYLSYGNFFYRNLLQKITVFAVCLISKLK